jgi:hypothetical protein
MPPVSTAVVAVEGAAGVVASLVFDAPQPEPRTARAATVRREAGSVRMRQA